MKIQLPDFPGATVLVAGDVMLDRYWHGPASRISPEAPVPVVRVEEVEERPGGAGNVALNIAAVGSAVTLLGLTGNDEAADVLRSRLENVGVDCYFQRLAGVPTVTKLRVLSRHQQLIRLDFESGFDGKAPELFAEDFERHLGEAGAVVFSDYGKGTLDDVPRLLTLAREAGKPVVIDPKGDNYDIYRGATVITPNLTEFEAVAGHCRTDEELVEKGDALRARLELNALLITRSEQGMSLLRDGHDPLHLSARTREVYDVTGAGDTVVSVLAAGLAAGLDLAEATALANLAAGIVVAKLGTATASVAELRRAVRDMNEAEQGLMTEAELLLAVEEARAHGEKVVMTNGCFDILHAGHVDYLQKAKALGDRLVVAVNDDASVRRLKGEQRPVNSLEHRMRVLSSLQTVDWVVPFSQDTPEEVICRVLPDFLVKGGDYRPEEIAGGGCVEQNGGEVVVLDYIPNVSTTRIIEQLQGGDS